MKFTSWTKGAFRKDGTVVIPFEYSVPVEKLLALKRQPEHRISGHICTIGVAVIDPAARRADMRIIRRYSNFDRADDYVRGLSPDGLYALVPSLHALGPTGATQGLLRRKIPVHHIPPEGASGLEVWDVSNGPRRTGVVPLRPLVKDEIIYKNPEYKLKVAWRNDQFVVATQDGRVREISPQADVGATFQLVKPCDIASPFAYEDHQIVDLQFLGGETFEFRHDESICQFDLPVLPLDRSTNYITPSPLMCRKIFGPRDRRPYYKRPRRPGETYGRNRIRIDNREPVEIVSGITRLAKAVTTKLEKMVFEGRWEPSLKFRDENIDEREFCDILLANPSTEAVEALDALLTAYVDATEGRIEAIWHLDDRTPTMGPVAMALIKLSGSLPTSVMRFYAHRDSEHDLWTAEAFWSLNLAAARLLKPDMIGLQVRLAIQDVCSNWGQVGFFDLYRLDQVRVAVRSQALSVSMLADCIVDQMKRQSPDFFWLTPQGIDGVVRAITQSFDYEFQAEVELAAAIMQRLTKDDAQ